MKLVVGLGNPGSRYRGTRHNVGFAVLDSLAKGPDVTAAAGRFDSDVAEWRPDGQKVLLVKPLTYMNLSGRAVRQFVTFYQVALTDLLVVCDDVNLPLGRLRVRARGTHGGHNGLRDIQAHLGTTEYARLRIGVGGAVGRDLADHVLDRFRPGEQAVIADAVALAAQAVEVWVRQGVETCMNRFNAKGAGAERSDD
jgi:PTH1 family peptidyl-tRNA hydrolase